MHHYFGRAAAGRMLIVLLLLVIPMAVGIYRAAAVSFDLERLAPNPAYRVHLGVFFDSPSDTVRVRAYLPRNEANLSIGARWSDTDLTNSDEQYRGGNRLMEWWGETEGNGKVETAFTVIAKNVTYDIAPALRVPGPPVEAMLPFLESTPTIQTDHPSIARLAEELAPTEFSSVVALRRIHEYCMGLAEPEPSPFTHRRPQDALSTLQVQTGSSLGKARLFAALARHQGFPTRLVHGVYLDVGPDQEATTWVEVRLGTTWVPFCSTRDLFARTEGKLVPFGRGDLALVQADPADVTEIRFGVEKTLGVRGRLIEGYGKAPASWLGVWGSLEEAGISMDILCLFLLLPFGALVSVLLRNVVGLRTFGFFLPLLIALAATHTGLSWAIAAFLYVIGAVYVFRLLVEPLRLLYFPRLAVILSATVSVVLGLGALGAMTGNINLARVTFLPVVVLTIAAEQFSTIIEEEGPVEVLKVTAMTVVGIILTFLIVGNHAVHMFVMTFPESVLVVVLLDIMIGSWTGMRVLEYLRFRQLLQAEPEEAPNV